MVELRGEDAGRGGGTLTPTPWGPEGEGESAVDETVIAGAAHQAKYMARRAETNYRKAQDPPAPTPTPKPPVDVSRLQPYEKRALNYCFATNPTRERDIAGDRFSELRVPISVVNRVNSATVTNAERRNLSRVLRTTWNHNPSWDACRTTDAEGLAKEGCPATLRLYLLGRDAAALASLRQMDRSLLHVPASTGNLALLIMLVSEFQFDISKVWPGRGTPLHTAASFGQDAVVSYLLTFDDSQTGLNLQEPVTRQTPLHLACSGGSLSVVKILLRHCVRINTANAKGETSLILACKHSYRDVALHLIERYDHLLTLDHQDGMQKTAVYYALAMGQLGILKALLSKGATLSGHGLYHTPVQLASRNAENHSGALRMVQYLVEEQGIAADSDNMHHSCPRKLALKAGNKELAAYLASKQEAEVVDHLFADLDVHAYTSLQP